MDGTGGLSSVPLRKVAAARMWNPVPFLEVTFLIMQ